MRSADRLALAVGRDDDRGGKGAGFGANVGGPNPLVGERPVAQLATRRETGPDALGDLLGVGLVGGFVEQAGAGVVAGVLVARFVVARTPPQSRRDAAGTDAGRAGLHDRQALARGTEVGSRIDLLD